jgi:hypothetical protein
VVNTPTATLIYDPTGTVLLLALAGAPGNDGALGNSWPAGLTVKIPASLLFPAGTSYENQQANITMGTGGSGAAKFIQMSLAGASCVASGARDQVYVLLNSANADGSSNANGDIVYQSSAGVAHEYAYWDASGFNIPTGSICAAQPGATSGSPVSPASWTNIPLQNGYGVGTNNGFIDNPQVRMLADNQMLMFKGTLATPATPSQIVWGQMPSGFPNANLGGLYGVSLVANYSGGTVDHIELHNNGNLSIHNLHNSINFDISGPMTTQ